MARLHGALLAKEVCMNSQLDHAKGLLAKARDDFFVVSRLAGEADAPGWVLYF